MSLSGYKPKHKKANWTTAFPEQVRQSTPKPKAKKPRKAIRRESKKRARDHKVYSRERIEFLKQNPFCQRPGCWSRATCIHHFSGRGIFYLDKSTWRASCVPCNNFAKEQPAKAIAEGWRAPVGVYRT